MKMTMINSGLKRLIHDVYGYESPYSLFHIASQRWCQDVNYHFYMVHRVTALCSEGLMFRRSYVWKVLCLEGSIIRRFYIQKVLCSENICSEGPIFGRFYVQKVLYSDVLRRSYIFRKSFVLCCNKLTTFSFRYRTPPHFATTPTRYNNWIHYLYKH